MEKVRVALADDHPIVLMGVREVIERDDRFFRSREVAGPSNAETRIDIIEQRGERCRYRLEPVTGKKHQLRVHMAALDMPLLYDSLYPYKRPVNVGDYAQPLQLLAKSMHFIDPISQQERKFVSQRCLLPLPAADFQDVWA